MSCPVLEDQRSLKLAICHFPHIFLNILAHPNLTKSTAISMLLLPYTTIKARPDMAAARCVCSTQPLRSHLNCCITAACQASSPPWVNELPGKPLENISIPGMNKMEKKQDSPPFSFSPTLPPAKTPARLPSPPATQRLQGRAEPTDGKQRLSKTNDQTPAGNSWVFILVCCLLSMPRYKSSILQ